MSSTIRIKIQGREYALRSEESEEQAQRVVAFVEQKLQETAAWKPVDTRDLTVLTLLNLAGQYLRLEDEVSEMSPHHRERIEALVNKMQQKPTIEE